MMLIAAIALIVFSIVGIATVMGWMPRALSGADPAEKASAAPAANAEAGHATERGIVAAD